MARRPNCTCIILQALLKRLKIQHSDNYRVIVYITILQLIYQTILIILNKLIIDYFNGIHNYDYIMKNKLERNQQVYMFVNQNILFKLMCTKLLVCHC